MEAYQIEPGPTGFRVVERLPSGREGHAFCGFPTEQAARKWVETYLGSEEFHDDGSEVFTVALTVY
jgi:hypothetical protein